MRTKKKKCPPEGAADWLLTYGDMVTLLLTFFIMLLTAAEVDGEQLKLILAAFSGLGLFEGGNTLSEGKLAELGNTIMSLPSRERGRALDKARKQAISLFHPERKSRAVVIKEDERGLVISIAADALFRPASAEINLEETREIIQKLSVLLGADDLKDRLFRIEGHTDNTPTDPEGPWETNWELSTARATNVLHYLIDFGVNEKQFQVAGFADTQPMSFFEEGSPEDVDYIDSPEGRAYNRRIDVVILTKGHL